MIQAIKKFIRKYIPSGGSLLISFSQKMTEEEYKNALQACFDAFDRNDRVVIIYDY